MRLEQSEPSGEKPTEGGTAADAAARAGELISPSEYQIEGAPIRLALRAEWGRCAGL